MLCSQRYRLVEDAIPDVAIQFVFRYHFHMPMKQLGQSLREWQPLCEQVVTPRKLDQKIHVAVGALFAARDRAKHADATGTVALTQSQDGSLVVAQFIEKHADLNSAEERGGPKDTSAGHLRQRCRTDGVSNPVVRRAFLTPKWGL